MISGTPMTEKDYRLRDELSQSMLKDFYEDRKKFYRKYIAKDFVEEDDPELAMKMGHLVDCKWLTPELFDEKFMMSICTKAPTEMMLDFCRALAVETKNATDDDGIVQKTFEEMATEAYKASGYKIKLDQVLGKFSGKDPEYYYQELVAAAVQKKIVVTQQQVENAEKIVRMIVTDELISRLVNRMGNVRYLRQYPITGFRVRGVLCKGLIDMLEIDDDEKFIQPWDLKCTWSVENWYEDYYLKRKGYLQTAMYDEAVTFFRDTYYPGYEVRPMKFLATDSSAYLRPLVYSLSSEDITDAKIGFVQRGRKYKGLNQLIDELQWHLNNNIWDISMENYNNQGVVSIQSQRIP